MSRVIIAAVIITVIVIVWTHLFRFKELLCPHLRNPKLPLREFRLSDDEAEAFEWYSENGADQAKRSSVVICGLVRNCSEELSRIREMVEDVSTIFGMYKILIVENDSTDDTREKLLNWAEEDGKVEILGCGLNAKECKLSLPESGFLDVSERRMKKMAYLRNLYLKHIREHYSGYDYTIIWDLDLDGRIYLDGIQNSLGRMAENPEISGMCANSLQYGLLGWKFYDTFAHLRMGARVVQFPQKIWYNLINPVRYKPGTEPVLVRSCFSGFGIYKTSRILESLYKPRADGKVTCEHISFCDRIPGMYVNPSMVYVILCVQ